MAVQVLVLGRPGDVRSAALGWSQLLSACEEVQTSLDKNITDLNQSWKGAGYESFKTHVKGIAKQLGDMVKDARQGEGIVTALDNAADKLTKAQADMPVPAECVGDLMAARNGTETIGPDFFHVSVHGSFFQSGPGRWVASGMDMVDDWLNNRTDDARRVYDQVDGEFNSQASQTPGTTQAGTSNFASTQPDLNQPGGGGSLPGSGGLPGGGGMPHTANLGGPGSGVGKIPGTGSGTGLPGSGLPGSGSFPGDGSGVDPSKLGGLAGAGGGLGGAGLGTSGLGGAGSGLGAAGGLGSGGLPGGGSLGKPTSMAGLGNMMGAGGMGGLGGGRAGSGSRSSGRGGAGGGGHGAGHGGAEDERTTWLQEDDDPWGSSSGTPGVLR
jgi:hypothetical protein